MNVILFLALRALHVFVAALWIGSAVFVSTLLTPAVEASGPSGGQVMMNIDKRGITAYMAGLAVVTVLTGLYLLWRFAGGFGAVGSTHAGIAFGAGGTAGVLAAIIGGSVVGRSAVRMGHLMREAAGLPEGPARAQLLRRSTPLKHRMKIGSRVVIALQMTALILMAVGHYV